MTHLLLDIQHLNFNFQDRILLKEANLQLAPGECIAILGSNGAGKSTLLKLILGLLKPVDKAGQKIVVDAIDVLKDTQSARQKVAYLPEQAVLYPQLTGMENLLYMLGLALGRKVKRHEVTAYLQRVGLQENAWDRLTAQYSKGMRQKLMIALALARNVKLMLLDEPNTGLDPVATRELNQIIAELKANRVGVLIVSHDLLSIHETADHQYTLQNGQLRLLDGSLLHRSMADLEAIFSSAAAVSESA